MPSEDSPSASNSKAAFRGVGCLCHPVAADKSVEDVFLTGESFNTTEAQLPLRMPTELDDVSSPPLQARRKDIPKRDATLLPPAPNGLGSFWRHWHHFVSHIDVVQEELVDFFDCARVLATDGDLYLDAAARDLSALRAENSRLASKLLSMQSVNPGEAADPDAASSPLCQQIPGGARQPSHPAQIFRPAAGWADELHQAVAVAPRARNLCKARKPHHDNALAPPGAWRRLSRKRTPSRTSKTKRKEVSYDLAEHEDKEDGRLAATSSYSLKSAWRMGERRSVRSNTSHGSSPVLWKSDSFNSQYQKILEGVDSRDIPDDDREWPAMIQIRHFGDNHDSDEKLWKRISANWKDVSTKTFQTRTFQARSTVAAESNRSHRRFCRRCPSLKAIDPHGLVRGLVDMFALIVLMYDLIVIPYMLAWDTVELYPGFFTSSLKAVAAFWIIEMIANFATGFYKNGEVNLGLRASMLHYVRTFFVFDLILVLLDVSYLVIRLLRDKGVVSETGFVDDDDFENLGFFRFARVLRFLRSFALLRPLRLQNVLNRLITHSFSDVLQMVAKFTKTCVILLWMCHAMCCAYLTLSRRCPSDTGHRWLNFSLEGLPTLEESGSMYQYFTVFHWAMSQITAGPMEYFPLNTAERAFTIICQLFGLIFGSYLVSSLSAIMIEIKQLRQEQTGQMQKLRQYLAQHSLSRSTSARVLQQAKDRLRQTHQITEKDVPVLQLLSNGLRAQVQYETMEPQIVQHPLFRLWSLVDLKALERLCWEAMQIVSCQRGDDLFGPGVEAQSAYLVMTGTLQYIPDIPVPVEDDIVPSLSELTGGKFEVRIGQSQWLAEACLWSYWMYVGRAEAEVHSQVVNVSAEKFASVAKKSPLMKEILQEYSRLFHQRIITARPPHVKWPDDSKVPFTEYSDIVASTSEEVRKIIGLVALQHMTQDWHELINLGGAHLKRSRLEKEVEAGKCTLIQNESGEVQRVVAVVALRIEDGTGMILCKIANWNRNLQQVDNFGCRLPGTKQERDEIPKEALGKLLYHELRPFKDFMKLTRVEQEVEWKESPHFGIRTKYLRTVGHGDITRMPPLMMMEKGMQARKSNMSQATEKSTNSRAHAFLTKGEKFKRRSDSRLLESLNTSDKDVYVIPSADTTSDKVGLYAWLAPSEFDLLSGKDGNQAIAAWLNKLWVPSSFELQFEATQDKPKNRNVELSSTPTAELRLEMVDLAGVPEAPAHPGSPSGSSKERNLSMHAVGHDLPAATHQQVKPTSIRHQHALRLPDIQPATLQER